MRGYVERSRVYSGLFHFEPNWKTQWTKWVVDIHTDIHYFNKTGIDLVCNKFERVNFGKLIMYVLDQRVEIKLPLYFSLLRPGELDGTIYRHGSGWSI